MKIRLQLPVTRNDLGSFVYITQPCSKGQSELERTVLKRGESLSDANTDSEESSDLTTNRNHQLHPEAKRNCETDNTRINETSDTQDINGDHEETHFTFKNSTRVILADNENDIVSNIFGKMF